MTNEREIVIPGEIIKEGEDFLPGEGTRREGNKIIASRFGLKDDQGRLIKIIPLSGIYVPRRGNLVIGVVTDISFSGWQMDLNAPYTSFLPLSECPRFFNKDDLSEYFDIGEMVVCKVNSVKRKGVDLTIKSRELGKLENGMVIYINSNKVPRVIGKEGSMIKIIKDATGCDITVGQNGIVWIRGKAVEEELFAKEAILFITNHSFINGLTDKVKEWLDKKMKEKGRTKKEVKEETKEGK